MKTRHIFASWLSTVETPDGTIATRIFTEGNDTMKPNAILYTTKGQFAGLKKQIPIKPKKGA